VIPRLRYDPLAIAGGRRPSQRGTRSPDVPDRRTRSGWRVRPAGHVRTLERREQPLQAPQPRVRLRRHPDVKAEPPHKRRRTPAETIGDVRDPYPRRQQPTCPADPRPRTRRARHYIRRHVCVQDGREHVEHPGRRRCGQHPLPQTQSIATPHPSRPTTGSASASAGIPSSASVAPGRSVTPAHQRCSARSITTGDSWGPHTPTPPTVFRRPARAESTSSNQLGLSSARLTSSCEWPVGTFDSRPGDTGASTSHIVSANCESSGGGRRLSIGVTRTASARSRPAGSGSYLHRSA